MITEFSMNFYNFPNSSSHLRGSPVNTTWDLQSTEKSSKNCPTAQIHSAHTMVIFQINTDIILPHKTVTFADYNWDWSLQYISNTCMPAKLHAISLNAPRVFHIGQCGTHTASQTECNSNNIVMNLRNQFDIAARAGYFYPENINSGFQFVPIFILKKNGGWGDERDHKLCMNITKYAEE